MLGAIAAFRGHSGRTSAFRGALPTTLRAHLPCLSFFWDSPSSPLCYFLGSYRAIQSLLIFIPSCRHPATDISLDCEHGEGSAVFRAAPFCFFDAGFGFGEEDLAERCSTEDSRTFSIL